MTPRDFNKCPCAVIDPVYYRGQLKVLCERHGEQLADHVCLSGECPQRALESMVLADVRGKVIPAEAVEL